ncbi:hypothetical protein SK128_013282, partial [Halocaridina rubra]
METEQQPPDGRLQSLKPRSCRELDTKGAKSLGQGKWVFLYWGKVLEILNRRHRLYAGKGVQI